MATYRLDPFREMLPLQQRLNSALQDANRGQDELLTTASFVPPVDIYEDGQKVTLKLEIPGVRQEELDIQLENHTLTVRGERKFAAEQKEENFHRIERRYGSFARSFTLPNTVDSEKVNANYEAGVLTIELAKRAEAKPKQIKVSVNGSPKQVEGGSVENKPAA